MSSAPSRRVANPPAKPLLLFDGDCHFCRRWVERWRETTAGRVDYASSQEAGARFPEIPPAEFARAVQMVEADGTVRSGAEAVFYSLGKVRTGRWLQWSYARVPGFAATTEFAYALVARHRMLASRVTRLLWGDDVRRPTYGVTRDLFLRALGIIFLFAFLSLWVQIDGLVGSGGILPVGEYLTAARVQLGSGASFVLPTLCWLNASNTALHFLCGAGVALSLLLVAGLLPALALAGLFACYLSLSIAGQTFFNFQWDILLLETGFLAIFFAPWHWRLRPGHNPGEARIGLFLLKLLLFKLMFVSGLVKLTSGDDAWWDLTALTYHFETQPLPTMLGWWAHQAPLWFAKVSTAFVLAVEVLAPFLIWAPRRLRWIAFLFLVALQILILLTGNYAFFNLLTIVLCLLLLDDAQWPRWLRRGEPHEASWKWPVPVQRSIAIGFTILLLPLNAWLIFNACLPTAIPPALLGSLFGIVEPYRIANSYGLFRVMTKERPEIVVEGSRDGRVWQAYEFRWKPGALKQAPRWVAPHQPRLDWQMWFAALGTYQQNRWFLRLSQRLLEKAPEVVALLKTNPFPDAPPRYLRAQLYRYHFSTRAERRATGAWWTASESGEYLPAVSLEAP